MAIETLKGVKTIDGFDVEEIPCIEAAHQGGFVKICHGSNTVSFRIQKGPIKENGINGCQVDTMVHAALLIIAALNGKYPCKENDEALKGLETALVALKARKANREKRGVEGENKL